jgi:GT2 family glycosyltransferase
MNMTQEDCKISVIIATRNRAEALEKISLPALAKQTFKDLEVILWDASDNENSAEVIKGFPELNIRYVKAPRVGSCSQRNDAVKVARGEIIYFIDDDSEPSPEVLEAIYEAMSTGELAGCSPPVHNSCPLKRKALRSILRKTFGLIKFFLKFLLLKEERWRRVVRKSGRNAWPIKETPLGAQWLSGCSMAFRKEVFADHLFDEELQKFGGYALGEDVMFTYRLYREGAIIKVLSKGRLLHHNEPGGRMNLANLYAAKIFNYYLIWKKNIYPYDKESILAFSLATISTACEAFLKLFIGQSAPLKGVLLGLKEIIKYKKKWPREDLQYLASKR